MLCFGFSQYALCIVTFCTMLAEMSSNRLRRYRSLPPLPGQVVQQFSDELDGLRLEVNDLKRQLEEVKTLLSSVASGYGPPGLNVGGPFFLPSAPADPPPGGRRPVHDAVVRIPQSVIARNGPELGVNEPLGPVGVNPQAMIPVMGAPVPVDIASPRNQCPCCQRRWSPEAMTMSKRDEKDWVYQVSKPKWESSGQSVRDKLHGRWYFGKPKRRNDIISDAVERGIERHLYDTSRPQETWLVIGIWNNGHCDVGCLHCKMYETFILDDLSHLAETDQATLNERSDSFCEWMFPILNLDFASLRSRW